MTGVVTQKRFSPPNFPPGEKVVIFSSGKLFLKKGVVDRRPSPDFYSRNVFVDGVRHLVPVENLRKDSGEDYKSRMAKTERSKGKAIKALEVEMSLEDNSAQPKPKKERFVQALKITRDERMRNMSRDFYIGFMARIKNYGKGGRVYDYEKQDFFDFTRKYSKFMSSPLLVSEEYPINEVITSKTLPKGKDRVELLKILITNKSQPALTAKKGEHLKKAYASKDSEVLRFIITEGLYAEKEESGVIKRATEDRNLAVVELIKNQKVKVF